MNAKLNLDLKAEWILVTPEMASAWLAAITKQRPCNARHVAFLAKEIAEERWDPNNDAVSFAQDGSLINGQHRLNAIVKAGKAAVLLVSRGLSTGSFTKMDTQRRRSGADMISIAGGARHVLAASIVHLVVAYERGECDSSGWPRLSNDDVYNEYLARKDDIDRAAVAGQGVPRGLRIGGSVVGGGHYLFAKAADPESADVFIHALKIGDRDVPAAYQFRESLLRRSKGKRPEGENLAVLIKAWNRFRATSPSASRPAAYFRARGKQQETFPAVS